MFRHLLVPLDGSTLAEAVMPAVRHFRALGAKVTLLHMLERKPPREIHGQPHLASADEAETYLKELAERTLPGGPVQHHVHTSKIDDVARSIADHAEELDIDLIVLCTHGAGGVRHAVFGSVAQSVIALGTIPVLLIPETRNGGARGFACGNILVPLDGNPDHEQGLAAVANLDDESGGEVRLLMVVPDRRSLNQSYQIASRTLPGTVAEWLDASCSAAEVYLGEKVAGLKSPGRAVSAEVVRGEPVRAIVQAAQGNRTDLIVLGTHGTTHLNAFWSESVTPQLLRKSRLPLLLVPVAIGRSGSFEK